MNDKLSGFLLVNKPVGISSFGVVYRVRKILKELTGEKYKVGHSGTLDPAASGLLILAIGKSTKKLNEFLRKDKTYDAEMTLGSISSTGDSEGEIKSISNKQPSETELKKVVNEFVGNISQTPPAYSAVKVNDQRAYKLARQNIPVVIEPRNVIIYSINILSYNYPVINLNCQVGSGTYIRSLVEDIGKSLQTGAYMSALTRTKIEKFSLENATSLDQITSQNIKSFLVNLDGNRTI